MSSATDGFPNYARKGLESQTAEMLIEKANLLKLTPPDMTALIGGFRTINCNIGQCAHGVFTNRPGTLTTNYFVNLLDMRSKWAKLPVGTLEGSD